MLNHYRHILSQNHWKTDRTLLSENLADWLLTEDSLTAKLERHCSHFSVNLIQQKHTEQGEWLREVVLFGDDQPWVFAQTHFSTELMAMCGEAILQLNQTPLGYWLFSQQPQRITNEWLQDSHCGLYARRSIFHIQGAALTVSELFLAEFGFPQDSLGIVAEK